jgi:hypothetical protein
LPFGRIAFGSLNPDIIFVFFFMRRGEDLIQLDDNALHPPRMLFRRSLSAQRGKIIKFKVEKISSTAVPQTQRKFFLITFSHTLAHLQREKEMGRCVLLFRIFPPTPLAACSSLLFVITYTHHSVVIDHLRYHAVARWDREIISSKLFHDFSSSSSRPSERYR